ncbi:hypothetical protein [Enterococcus italicus]|uniref:hypothetical protein n=1 Tax=Enterococcus italicus TaxID=246144 RepID=UPI003F445B31
MRTKRYIEQYNDDYLSAEARADAAFGSYVYIARKGVPRKDRNTISIEETKDGWRVEYRWEPDEKIQNILGLKFIRRGEL